MPESILFVDDEPHVLAGLRRILRGRFSIETASSGVEALQALASGRTYAVVVSDMRMPEMDGVHFLARARSAAPDSVRMMLTGNADVRTAIEAVNQGTIFRFLTKPCPAEELIAAIEAAIVQYDLVQAEKVLLERTLQGCVHVLVEMLSLVSPAAFSRALRLRRIVHHLVVQLALAEGWRYEIAAALSQIACVTLPDDALTALAAGRRLSAQDEHCLALHPSVAYDLLESIPRLELVARMIARQQEPCFEFDRAAGESRDDEIVRRGACLLRVALELDRWLSQSVAPSVAIARMEATHAYPRALLDALKGMSLTPLPAQLKTVRVSRLESGMVLNEDLRTHAGLVLVGRGQRVTAAVLARLANFARAGEIDAAVQVLVPSADDRDVRASLAIAPGTA
jgi:CheY-like chemotaxis protein